jgi:colanic acid biosynthesis glycosyl transferase WcaI
MPGDAALRILIVGVNYAPEPTGIAPYTSGIAAGLASRGHDVSVVTTFPHYPRWHYGERPPSRMAETLDGVTVNRVRHYVPRRPTTWNRAFFELAFGVRAASLPWRDPDVVLTVSPALVASAFVACRARLTRRGAGLGLVIQDLYSDAVGETGAGGSGTAMVMRGVESGTAQLCDGVAVIHERFKARVGERLGIDPGRVTVIRNWSHLSATSDFDEQAFRAELGWGTNETVILHAGAMGAKQGLENVVDAAAVADREALPLRFVLMGDGNQRAQLEGRASGLKRLQFLDPLDDLSFRRALRCADILLVNERPGLMEMAVPSKLTSYFTSGRPVVAATEPNSITAHELVASRAGVRVDPGQPKALVHAVLNLSDEREVQAAMGAAGRSYAASVLSRESAIEAYDQWVRALAHLRDRRRVGQP